MTATVSKAATRSTPVPARSSTVVVLRDAQDEPEALLVRRHSKASFGASHAFPGGLHEDGDADVADLCDGCSESLACACLGVEAEGLKYYSAAIRELFEETGVLLARRNSAQGVAALVENNDFDQARQRIHSGDLSWRTFLQQHDLRLACDQLHYFSYWVTPRDRTRRYTTRFFVCALPQGQQAWHDGTELTDSCWLTPTNALSAADAGELVLPPPTRATLADLAGLGAVDDALAWARQQQTNGVPCILPAVIGKGDATRIVLPGDPDYPADLEGQQE